MIPNGLPTIAHGGHSSDSGKACVMEYISFLKGEKWTDSPACVDPEIAGLMRSLNDSIKDDATRSRLLVPLIGKVMVCSRQNYNVASEMYERIVVREDLNRQCMCGQPQCMMGNPAAVITGSLISFAPWRAARLMERVLDEYIRTFGLAEEPVETPVLVEAEAKILARVQ